MDLKEIGCEGEKGFKWRWRVTSGHHF